MISILKIIKQPNQHCYSLLCAAVWPPKTCAVGHAHALETCKKLSFFITFLCYCQHFCNKQCDKFDGEKTTAYLNYIAIKPVLDRTRSECYPDLFIWGLSDRVNVLCDVVSELLLPLDVEVGRVTRVCMVLHTSDGGLLYWCWLELHDGRNASTEYGFCF